MTWWCSATGQAWSWTWRAYPGVWLFVLLVAGVYWWLRGRGGEPKRTAAAVAATVLLWISLDWPVGPLGAGHLLSVHTLQFLLLALVIPPLLLYGVPRARWARLEAHPRALAAVRLLTHPIVAVALFNVVVLATHAPPILDPLMVTQIGDFAVNASWLLAGIVFWWLVIVPVPVRRGGRLLKVGYVFVGTLAHTGLSMYFLLAEFALFRSYELAPPLPGVTALTDQAWAGGLMEMGGAAIIFGVILGQLIAWYREEGDPVGARARVRG